MSTAAVNNFSQTLDYIRSLPLDHFTNLGEYFVHSWGCSVTFDSNWDNTLKKDATIMAFDMPLNLVKKVLTSNDTANIVLAIQGQLPDYTGSHKNKTTWKHTMNKNYRLNPAVFPPVLQKHEKAEFFDLTVTREQLVMSVFNCHLEGDRHCGRDALYKACCTRGFGNVTTRVINDKILEHCKNGTCQASKRTHGFVAVRDNGDEKKMEEMAANAGVKRSRSEESRQERNYYKVAKKTVSATPSPPQAEYQLGELAFEEESMLVDEASETFTGFSATEESWQPVWEELDAAQALAPVQQFNVQQQLVQQRQQSLQQQQLLQQQYISQPQYIPRQHNVPQQQQQFWPVQPLLTCSDLETNRGLGNFDVNPQYNNDWTSLYPQEAQPSTASSSTLGQWAEEGLSLEGFPEEGFSSQETFVQESSSYVDCGIPLPDLFETAIDCSM